MNSEN
jgi:hypothetical protein